MQTDRWPMSSSGSCHPKLIPDAVRTPCEGQQLRQEILCHFAMLSQVALNQRYSATYRRSISRTHAFDEACNRRYWIHNFEGTGPRDGGSQMIYLSINSEFARFCE